MTSLTHWIWLGAFEQVNTSRDFQWGWTWNSTSGFVILITLQILGA